MKNLFQIKQNFLGENECITFDYSNPQHQAYFLERFGGEEFLKVNFPAIYRAFIKTKEAHQAIKAGTDDMKDTAFYVTAIGIESPQNKNLQVMKSVESGELSSNTQLHLIEESPSIIMIGQMMDLTTDQTLNSFAEEYEITKECNNQLKYPYQDILGFNEHKLESKSECHYLNPDGTFESRFDSSSTYLVAGSTQIIPSFVIMAPKSKSTPGNNPIIVLYNRDPGEGETADYSYSGEQIGLKDNQVNTLMPIEGSFTVADGFEAVEFSKTSRSKLPMLLYQGDGVVEYGCTIEDIASFFKIDSSKKNVTFKFNDDWKARLDLSHYEVKVQLKLEFSFFFTVKQTASGALFDIPFSITSLINPPTGGYYEAIGPSVSIPEISIRWGCFHKNTMIQMADGRTKPIKDITSGEEVALMGGGSLKVKSIVTGTEKELIHIESENGLALEVTNTHPVAVQRGYIPAQDLNAADILKLADGTTSKIKYLYPCEYNDQVYNLDTGMSQTMLIANGLLAGDLTAQNEQVKKCEAPVFSEETLEVAREMKQLFKLRFENNV